MKNELLFLIFSLTITMNGQVPSSQFSKCLGSPQGDDYGRCILQTSDGGFIVASKTGYYTPMWGVSNGAEGNLVGGSNSEGGRIFKLGTSGNIIWQTYIREFSDFTSMVATNDGSYIVIGNTKTLNNPYYAQTENQIGMVKISSNGVIVWQKVCAPNNNDFYGNIIKKTNDGGYIITGKSRGTNSSYEGDYYIIKLDSNANYVWDQIYGTYDTDQATDIIQCTDQGYLITGIGEPTNGLKYPVVSQGEAGKNILIIKVDSLGKYKWSKWYGGSGTEYVAKLLNTSDGGYLLTGTTNSNDLDVSGNHGGYDNWIAKINSIGDIQWQKTYGGTKDDYFSDIFQSSDGNYVFSSNIASNDGDITFNNGNLDSWVVKISKTTGAILWQKSFGGSGRDETSSIVQSTDGGYALTGATNSTDGDITGYHNFGGSPRDIMVIKFSNDNLSTKIFNKDEISIYPNPANDQITIDCGTLTNVNAWNIKITNMLGQEVFNQPINTQQYVVSLKTWSGQGVYFVKLYNDQGILVNTKKIIVQ